MNTHTQASIIAPAFAVAFAAGAWGGDPVDAVHPRNTDVGRAIALQGNRALAEIRADLRLALKELRPTPLGELALAQRTLDADSAAHVALADR